MVAREEKEEIRCGWDGPRVALKTLATKGPRSMEEIEEYLSNAATSNGFGWLGEWQGGPSEWVL